MITGFNTDIEYEGVVYHVQTEDKGLDSPIILSLVYAGGAILASKRSPYQDLIKQGFSDELLAERLKRQHRLICAAIYSGRLNDLKKMSAREVGSSVAVQTEEEEQKIPAAEFELEVGDALSQKYEPPPPAEHAQVETEEEQAEEEEQEETLVPAPPPVGAYRIAKEPSALESPMTPAPIPAPPEAPLMLEQGLLVRLLDDVEFYSGDSPTLRVLVTERVGYEENPVPNATVSIKILGTTFRPLIYSLKTQRDGIASLSTQIPEFTSGRAAVLIRAMVKDEAAELRCVIHPNK